MATVCKRTFPSLERLELHNGDHMARDEFHRIYEQTPEGFHAELIGGIVYLSERMKVRPARYRLSLGALFGVYEANTLGVEASLRTTILLGEDSEPEPDLLLRIVPDCGGRSRTTDDDFVAGAPELLGEIALSKYSITLHAKKGDYARHGVQEYLVLSLQEHTLRWFDLKSDRVLPADADGVLRGRVFPGLWIHEEALLAHDSRRLLETLQRGLASPEHEAFANQLVAARTAGS